MDDILIAVYSGMVRCHQCSADDILHDPELRGEFLSHLRQNLGTQQHERELLSRLTYLRKRSRLPRSRELARSAEGHAS